MITNSPHLIRFVHFLYLQIITLKMNRWNYFQVCHWLILIYQEKRLWLIQIRRHSTTPFRSIKFYLKLLVLVRYPINWRSIILFDLFHIFLSNLFNLYNLICFINQNIFWRNLDNFSLNFFLSYLKVTNCTIDC